MYRWTLPWKNGTTKGIKHWAVTLAWNRIWTKWEQKLGIKVIHGSIPSSQVPSLWGKKTSERRLSSDAECHKRHKKGHFSTQCCSSVVLASLKDHIQHDCNSLEEEAFLERVERNSETCLQAETLLHNNPVTFKMDTGAGQFTGNAKSYWTSKATSNV